MLFNRKIFAVIILIVAAFGLFWVLNDKGSNILVSNVRAVNINDKAYTVYLDMENQGGPDILTGISALGANRAFVMGADDMNAIAIPEGSKPGFSSDGAHIMVMHESGDLKDGQFITLTLTFENAGNIQAKALIKNPTTALENSTSEMTKEQSTMNQSKMSHSEMDHTKHGMGAMVEVDKSLGLPVLDMTISKNSDANGWELNIKTENFEFFEPETEPLTHVAGQGHGHLYLNGLKLQRMYSNKATIGALLPGTYTITVTLNTNDHKAYAINGAPLSASATIEVN